ncbi:hypothetical protein NC653_021528 [Populus alba x Populus x berolinensis]|uniref:Uncharacterized protein n=1 Tax=Populus alba x Populus x berolinensis TaxID=444605 RepID=A0AAD6MPW2_9ROSI|nr:hypothetical protein NC653_021528 [Populus alba x Populus x berolinensis]
MRYWRVKTVCLIEWNHGSILDGIQARPTLKSYLFYFLSCLEMAEHNKVIAVQVFEMKSTWRTHALVGFFDLIFLLLYYLIR